MLVNCKLCNREIKFEAGWCQYCKQYSWVSSNGEIESELISCADFRFLFIPHYHEANVVLLTESGMKTIKRFELNELTAELSKEWLQRLKGYLVFA